MYIAETVSSYLSAHDVDFEVVPHRRSWTSVTSALQAHIEPEYVAKAVLLRDHDEFLLAVLPASHRIDGEALASEVGDWFVGIADEDHLSLLFRDCERGAVPALGKAYGLDTIVDMKLLAAPDVYFEAGDHEHLIHVSGDDFRRLMGDARRGMFAYPS